MRIHQFVHTLTLGDAISGEALAIRRLLREAGHQSEIFCLNVHDKLEDFAKRSSEFAASLKEAEQAGEQTAVLLHYSIASPLNQLLLSTPGIHRGLIYHNLTPVHWFSRYNSVVAGHLAEGRAELPALLRRMDLVLADSAFNQQELQELGRADAEVLPLLLDSEKWSVAPNQGISSMLKSAGTKHVLHVGRFAPNKCIEDIIKSFYFYHHKIEEKSRLWLIGSDVDTEIYSFELRRLVSELRLKEAVFFVGSVSDCELKAFYENADLYVCMSEHEGFCVPLLEAMHFNVPVIAFDSCAVGDTLGDGGVLVQEKRHAEIAELMHLVLADPGYRQKLTRRAGAQLARFSENSFREALTKKVVEPFERFSKQTSAAVEVA